MRSDTGCQGRIADEYFLKSERLGFRWWSEGDIELALGLWGNPDVTRLIGGPFTDEQVQERLARERACARKDRIQYWPIFLIDSGEHVGCCGLRGYQSRDRVYELGFHLRPAYWGLGLAKEAGRAVIGFAFERLDPAAVVAGHHPENEASRRVLTALGFTYTHDERYGPTGLLHRMYMLPHRREAT